MMALDDHNFPRVVVVAAGLTPQHFEGRDKNLENDRERQDVFIQIDTIFLFLTKKIYSVNYKEIIIISVQLRAAGTSRQG